MQSKEATLTRFKFFGDLKRGRKFEDAIQREIREVTFGSTYSNVIVDRMEFDAIVADYPLMTFVEIKAYRSDFSRDRIKKALIKLVRNCVCVTEDVNLSYRDWVPVRNRWETVGNRKFLLRKLKLDEFDGWRFRMMLIVPDKSFRPIMEQIEGKRMGSNLLDIEGFPLLLIPRRRIKEVF